MPNARRRGTHGFLAIAVDVEDPSVILGYTLETLVYDDMGEEVERRRKALQKRCVGTAWRFMLPGASVHPLIQGSLADVGGRLEN